jgi:hypothetical protein
MIIWLKGAGWCSVRISGDRAKILPLPIQLVDLKVTEEGIKRLILKT